MIRIDEYTYIDDSLVTCAEYQLFIDEMREMGKFVQPEHWTSYQFPSGLARTPILGVYPADAVAFCNWLTLREKGEWHFRLPTIVEATIFPLNASDIQYFCYWIEAKPDMFQLIGMNGKLINAKALDSTHTTDEKRRSLEKKSGEIRSLPFEGIRIVKERIPLK